MRFFCLFYDIGLILCSLVMDRRIVGLLQSRACVVELMCCGGFGVDSEI